MHAPLAAHADDLHIMHEEDLPIQRTYGVVSDYLSLTGIPVQPKKTQCLRAKVGNHTD